jgi:hypothetical protein
VAPSTGSGHAFLESPSPPAEPGSPDEDARSPLPNLYAVLMSVQTADSPPPTCPQRLAQRRLANPQIRRNTRARQPAGQCNTYCFLLKLFTMLDHLVGLLNRVFNAQVTGTKPLQVHTEFNYRMPH